IGTAVLDLQDARETIAALLIAIGSPRRLGLELHDLLPGSPEHRLYELLAIYDSDSAHARYNALIRRLVSFERAAECAKTESEKSLSESEQSVSESAEPPSKSAT